MNAQGEQAANIMLSALLCGRYRAAVRKEARVYSVHPLPLDRLSQGEKGAELRPIGGPRGVPRMGHLACIDPLGRQVAPRNVGKFRTPAG